MPWVSGKGNTRRRGDGLAWGGVAVDLIETIEYIGRLQGRPNTEESGAGRFAA